MAQESQLKQNLDKLERVEKWQEAVDKERTSVVAKAMKEVLPPPPPQSQAKLAKKGTPVSSTAPQPMAEKRKQPPDEEETHQMASKKRRLTKLTDNPSF